MLEHARDLLHPVPPEQALDCPTWARRSTAAWRPCWPRRAIEAIRFVYGQQPETMPGLHAGRRQLHQPAQRRRRQATSTAPSTTSSSAPGASSWSTAACPASPPSSAAPRRNEVAVKIVRELQQRNILIFLCGNVNGRSIIHQLHGRGRRAGLRHLHRALRHRHHLGHLRPGLRHPLGADLRRHEGRPGRATSCSTTRTASSPSCWPWARSTT